MRSISVQISSLTQTVKKRRLSVTSIKLLRKNMIQWYDFMSHSSPIRHRKKMRMESGVRLQLITIHQQFHIFCLIPYSSNQTPRPKSNQKRRRNRIANSQFRPSARNLTSKSCHKNRFSVRFRAAHIGYRIKEIYLGTKGRPTARWHHKAYVLSTDTYATFVVRKTWIMTISKDTIN